MLRSIIAAAVLAASTTAFAATAKTYQVTGSVVAVDATTITVLKGKSEKFQIAKNASTKTTGEVKVGEKVTVKYAMTATDIEVKAAKTPAKAKAKKETKAAAPTK